MKRAIPIVLIALGAALFTFTTASAATLEIELRHSFNDDPLILDSLRYRNAAGETLSVTRLSYLLSGFALERAEGGWNELPDTFAWIDVATHRTSIRLNSAPAAHYRALRFSVGVDPITNASEPSTRPPEHPLNPNLNNLYWGWQGGYIFVAAEGHYRSAVGETKGYAFHLAHDPNRTPITLTAQLDLTHEQTLLIDCDLATVLNAPRPLSFERNGAATHSREGDPIAAALVANLPGAFQVRQIINTAPTATLPSTIRPLYLPDHFTPYRLTIGKSFPIPDLPRDNPLLEERVALGQRLFNETSLSRNGSISCASCHQASAGFSDPRNLSVGVDGRLGARHAMPLTNLAWKSNFFWDGRVSSLREQVLIPIQNHVEMDESLDRVVGKLTADPTYPPLFRAAFGVPDITPEKLGLALENYLLTLSGSTARFDRVLRGQATFTDDERRGFELFMTEYEPRTGQRGADCFHCHGGALFTDHQFHNNGLAGADPGRAGVTSLAADRSRFATPSLRNVGLRAPYMHDGRFATLEQVVAHYDHGVERSPTLDPNLAKHPAAGLQLSAVDQQALVAFLKTLSDER